VLSSLASLIPVAFERALGTEAALAHEARLRAVVETSPVALVGMLGDGTVNLANRAALELFGWNSSPIGRVVEGPVRGPLISLAEEVLHTRTVISRPLSLDASSADGAVSSSGAEGASLGSEGAGGADGSADG